LTPFGSFILAALSDGQVTANGWKKLAPSPHGSSFEISVTAAEKYNCVVISM
jgi:hypothetical protein